MLSLFLIWRLNSKPQHGYSILKEIKGIAIAPCKPSTVYSLLSKLEKAGLVTGVDSRSFGRMRRLYHTTPKGYRLYLQIKKAHIRGLWKEFALALSSD